LANETKLIRVKTMTYDSENIFARIIRGEIPADKVYEDDYVLAFHDIAKLTPIHVLIIPKMAYNSIDDFSERASDAELAAYVRAIGVVARELGVSQTGYRVVTNSGADANQEVMHFHSHIFGGRKLGGVRPS